MLVQSADGLHFIEVEKNNDNVMLVGDGIRSSQDGYTTYSSATAGIDGLHFIARDITQGPSCGPEIRLRPVFVLPRHAHGPRAAPILQTVLHLRHR
ncbi:hypothetical protein AAHE18_08G115300 [Arachis hypogaea]